MSISPPHRSPTCRALGAFLSARHRTTAIRGCLGFLVVVVAAALAQPAFAARVDVQDGRLTIAADAAERLSVQIVHYRLPGVVLTDYQVSSFSPTDTVVTALVAGDGCTGGGVTRGLSSVRCPVAGVGAITITGADADDYVQLEGDFSVPTLLSGGGGSDELIALRTRAPVTVLSGPGDDKITVNAAAGSVIDAGEGADEIGLQGGAGTVDCGPGTDSLAGQGGRSDRARDRIVARWTINPASCPSVLQGLLRPDATVRLGRDGRLSVALFRSSEAVTGTIRLRRAPSRSRRDLVSVGRPTRITVPAGGVVRERRLLPAALRKSGTRTLVFADVEVRDSAGESTVRRVGFVVRPARRG